LSPLIPFNPGKPTVPLSPFSPGNPIWPLCSQKLQKNQHNISKFRS
jgi:hypothetical protein